MDLWWFMNESVMINQKHIDQNKQVWAVWAVTKMTGPGLSDWNQPFQRENRSKRNLNTSPMFQQQQSVSFFDKCPVIHPMNIVFGCVDL